MIQAATLNSWRRVRHGFFTLGLVEGLGGRADYNGDRVVHFAELDRFTARRVRELSGRVQNPVTARPPTVRSGTASSRPAPPWGPS